MTLCWSNWERDSLWSCHAWVAKLVEFKPVFKERLLENKLTRRHCPKTAAQAASE